MIKYYDTHSHLNMEEYQDELKDCIKNLEINNTFTNCVGCDLKSSIKAVELANQYPNLMKACVGVHPNEVENYLNDDLIFKKLDELIAKNRNSIVAIGEIGLDFYYSDKFKKEQEIFCNRQIELGIKYNLPIMFHLRNAFDEIKPIIEKYQNIKKLIHCFSSNLNEANFYLSKNCYISIPGIVTFKNATSLQEAVKEIDLNKLVVETDSPYLTPVPFRGKKNYPHYVKHTVEFIAKIKELPISEVEKKVLQNAKEFFGVNF